MTLNKALFSSAKGDWQTPSHIAEAVRKFYGGTIDLDPCTTRDNPVGAKAFYTPDEDGLQSKWPSGAKVYMNPPYGREIRPWTSRAAIHDGPVIMLVPARTDTTWFQELADRRFCSFCFIKGRLTFKGAPAPAPFPSVLIYFYKNPTWPDRYDATHDLFGVQFKSMGTIL